MKLRFMRRQYPRLISWLLAGSLVCQPSLVAPLQGQPPAVQLVINVVSAQSIKMGTGFATSKVLIKDDKNNSLPGVKVLFALQPPDDEGGASSVFRDGSRTVEKDTDANGEAKADEICPIGQPGKFSIIVTATYGDKPEKITDIQESLSPEVGKLAVIATKGQAAVNDIRPKHRVSFAPEVQVLNADTKAPVSCVKVTFSIPKAKSEAGAAFQNKREQANVFLTDAQGKATAIGYTANDKPGKFKVNATASLMSLSSGVMIDQQNFSGGKTLLILGGVGVAGGVAAAVLLSTHPPPPGCTKVPSCLCDNSCKTPVTFAPPPTGSVSH